MILIAVTTLGLYILEHISQGLVILVERQSAL